ncbi:MAG: MgtC/SapB family protein [Arhodomonas sp.]|nr:MgtC/SapB family protein [Arhodomonas sp.]
MLQHLDLRQHLDKPDYRRRKRALGRSLTAATWRAHHHGISLVVVLEGWDASGKGGAIRRLLQGIDARLIRVIQVGPPSDEERAHPYLWRFWRHLPRDGHVTVYDRSWYGRVLVERVRGLTPEARWREAYAEINDFEDQLIAHGTALVKCYLHIDADEQLRRFRARQRTPHKRHKLTDEDWENRALRPDYEKAVHEMVTHTSTGQSPWHLIAANDKRHARVEVMRHCAGHPPTTAGAGGAPVNLWEDLTAAQSPLPGLLLALLLGAVIGLQRGWQGRELPAGQRIAGFRTYTLVGLLGGFAVVLHEPLGPWPGVALLLAMAAAALIGFGLHAREAEDYSITGIVGLLLTFCFGALAVAGEPVTAAAAAVVTAFLLDNKTEIHGLLRRLSRPGSWRPPSSSC